MKQIKVSDEVHARLLEYADGRPLGLAIERLLDAENDWERVEANTSPRPSPSPGLDADPPTHQADTSPPEEGKTGYTATIEEAARQSSRYGERAAPSRSGAKRLNIQGVPAVAKLDLCTCGPGERAKGKHNKKCPARGA